MATKSTFASGAVPRGTLGVNIIKRVSNGGGIKGIMPRPIRLVNKDYNEYENTRGSLVNAWNTSYQSQLHNASRNRIITPFRAVTNAGDVLARVSYSCGGSSQTPQSRPGLPGLSNHLGNIRSSCDNTGVPASACNVKYVYDSSDYIRYKKQSSFVKNYNDISYGGDNNFAGQSAIKNLRGK